MGRGRKKRTKPVPCTTKDDLNQNVPVQSLPSVNPLPHYRAWNYVPKNVMMQSKDSFKNLNWVPYFDESTLEQEKDFIQEISVVYCRPEPVEAERVRQETLRQLSDHDTSLFDLVTSLMANNEQTSNVEEGLAQTVAQISMGDDNTLLVEDFRQNPEALKQKLKEDCPSDKICHLVCDKLNIDRSNVELVKQKFMKLCLMYNKEKYYNVPNIDSSRCPTLKREKALSSFQRLFCRRCFIYNCPTHYEVPQPTEWGKKIGDPVIPKLDGCGEKCALTHPICRQSSKSGEKTHTGLSSPDKSLFHALAPVFPNNPCAIAEILMKDCNQVHVYAQKKKIMSIGRLKAEAIRSDHPQTRSNGVAESEDTNSVKSDNSSESWTRKRKLGRPKAFKTVQPKNPSRHVRHSAPYICCVHPGTPCTRVNGCCCKANDTHCEKYCTCEDDCPNKFKGCRCAGPCNLRYGPKACPCFEANRECDPDLCKRCGANEYDAEKANCKNNYIQKGLHKHLLWSPSTITEAGWGIFAKDSIKKGEFVYEYCGEMIDHKEADRRCLLYDKRSHTFMFELNDEAILDATRYGNKIRFANHDDKPNLSVKSMLVNGDHRIALYAKRDIEPEEELFLSYKGVLEKHKELEKQREKQRKMMKLKKE